MRQYLCLGLMFFLTMTGHATAHVFVQTREGVWLASDSLSIHDDANGQHTQSNSCKVVISRGRLIFNAGSFKDSTLLRSQEAALPFEDAKVTKALILELLKTNHMDLTRDPTHTADQLVVNSGILQVDGHGFTELMFGQTDDLRLQSMPVNEIKMGVPHGFGTTINRVRDEAYKDPALAAWIAGHPKEELLKILNEEASTRPTEVEPPFTVLLLHNDGTVSDYSDQPLCTIPADAVHVEHADPKHITSK